MASQDSKSSSPGSENEGLQGSNEARPERSGKGARKSGLKSGLNTGLNSGRKRERKPRKVSPLDETGLRDLALSYVARFSTTGAKLESYLARKLRTRGVAEDDDGTMRDLDVTGIVTRMIELGYIDDEAYARSRSRDLTARGYGARRVEQVLWAAGVDEEIREGSAPGEAESRRAAILLAKKRRFGPFARSSGDGGFGDDKDTDRAGAQKKREKQVAAMLRAGHLYDHVRFILGASEMADIEEWLAEAEGDETREEDGSW
jgi:regulatory protein